MSCYWCFHNKWPDYISIFHHLFNGSVIVSVSGHWLHCLWSCHCCCSSQRLSTSSTRLMRLSICLILRTSVRCSKHISVIHRYSTSSPERQSKAAIQLCATPCKSHSWHRWIIVELYLWPSLNNSLWGNEEVKEKLGLLMVVSEIWHRVILLPGLVFCWDQRLRP